MSSNRGPFFQPKLRYQCVLRLLRFQRPSSGGAADSLADAEGADPLKSLVSAATGGDENAERTLLVTLGPALLRAVRGVLGGSNPDVEDALQDSMAALHAALPRFRGECGTLHFACRVAVQTALNARRRASYRNRHTPSVSPDELSELAADERSPAEAQAAASRRDALRRLLDELPPVQAEALVLHVVLGYSIDETARATDSPRDTVRSRLRTALGALRARVGADGALLEILDVQS
jgi:RNA polymerase sigma-70 factor (ECF subfamily)